MFPVQGLLNFLIYLRPRFKLAKKHHSEMGTLTCIKLALFEENIRQAASGTKRTTDSGGLNGQTEKEMPIAVPETSQDEN